MTNHQQLVELTRIVTSFNYPHVSVVRIEKTHIIIACKGAECTKAVREKIMQANTWAIEVKAGLVHNTNRYIKVHLNK
jgi:hypothetical protein